MARQCHLNSCPTGIATQRADLRAKFRGTPEQVVAYFTALAEDVRHILAGMGHKSLDEIVGRVDLLERVDRPEVPRAQMLDLSLILADALGGPDAPRRACSSSSKAKRTTTSARGSRAATSRSARSAMRPTPTPRTTTWSSATRRCTARRGGGSPPPAGRGVASPYATPAASR